MEEIEEKNKRNESSLKDHKLHKKELNPPFLANGINMTTSSWFDERLPEMLWAVLIVGNMDREDALKFFRYVAEFVASNHECWDVTLTGISRLPEEKRKLIIKHFANYSEKISNNLCAMLLFSELPCFTDWKEAVPEPNPEEAWQILGQGISKTFWHQSQEATDCRWIKVLCAIVGDRIKFAKSLENKVQEILEYPNRGDIHSVRPSIRAMEIGPWYAQEIGKSKWAKYFWQYCYDHTGCIPEESVNQKIKDRQKKFIDEMDESRSHYYQETVEIRKKLISHFFLTSKTSAIDSRHEGSFGITLYAFSIFIEIIFYNATLSVTGRLGLRALVEAYITFSYLLIKEKTDARVWDDFRSYGTGQIKLIYLKLQEMNCKLSSIEINEMDRIANEDKWVEFVPISLGHWDYANLRKMAEDTGLKDLYDKFYNYTSGFMHSNWGAIREAVYQNCINPLHRHHRIPIFDLPLMPSVTDDAQELINKILESLSMAYPSFNDRITSIQQNHAS